MGTHFTFSTPWPVSRRGRTFGSMKNYKSMVLAVMSAVALSVFTTGCDRTVSETEKTKVGADGTVKSERETVTQNPDGTVTRTEEEKKTEPAKP